MAILGAPLRSTMDLLDSCGFLVLLKYKNYTATRLSICYRYIFVILFLLSLEKEPEYQGMSNTIIVVMILLVWILIYEQSSFY